MFNIENNQKPISKIEKVPPFEIENLEEANQYIKEMFENGERPIVTVPRKYIESLKQGLKPYSTWVGVALIAATFGRDPYIPKKEERIIVNIDNISIDQIKPRFTGPKKAFSGVVVLDGPIPPDSISYEI